MIVRKHGNIFESTCECLVNPVNTVGVMGKGLAKQFADRYPEMLATYKSDYRAGLLRVGQISWFFHDDNRPTIANFPTKRDWRNPSRLEWIDEGLQTLSRALARMDIPSVAIPPLGCGLGGLTYSDVYSLIEKHFLDSRILVEVYE